MELGSGINTGIVKIFCCQGEPYSLVTTLFVNFHQDHKRSHNCLDGQLRRCARNKHAVANELDEPLHNLFQWTFSGHLLLLALARRCIVEHSATSKGRLEADWLPTPRVLESFCPRSPSSTAYSARALGLRAVKPDRHTAPTTSVNVDSIVGDRVVVPDP